MVEKLKDFLKKSFSNGPKAKIILALTIALILGATVITSMRKTITVTIDGKEQTFVTYKGTVESVLQSMGVTIEDKDKVQPALKSVVSEDDTITVKKAMPVKLTMAGQELNIKTAENTVLDMLKAEKETLKEKGLEYVEGTDEVSLPLDTTISRDMEIKVVKVEFEDISETKVLAYDTVTKENSTITPAQGYIEQQGSNGEEKVTYRVTRKDGVEVSREVVESTVVVKPVNAIKVVGTLKSISRGGSDISYKRALTMQATAYSPQCVGGNKTATGTYPRRDPSGISTIAVDPSVIPLGSLVYIDGYGYARAEDTGGAIRGNIIDVFVGSHGEAISWGRKTVTVSIVE